MVLSRLAALRSAKSAELWNCLSSKAATNSLLPAETAEKIFWVLKIYITCLCLFCKIAKMTVRLVFDGEKNQNSCTSKLLHNIQTKLKKCWLVFADMFLSIYINHHVYFFRTLLLLLFSVQWVIADFTAASKKNAGSLDMPDFNNSTNIWTHYFSFFFNGQVPKAKLWDPWSTCITLSKASKC